MKPMLLLGDEAIALAAIDAGIAGAFAYPGTPSTEIFEYVQAHAEEYDISALWSANEKVAYEEALGMSYAGKRALISMKHVGLNVAADPFINSALTGVGGGIVLVIADDPGMHSSQNEQDSRFYGDFAQLPILEPSDQQNAYDMTREAFDYSEEIGLPVMVRIVTRLAHSRANIVRRLREDPDTKPQVTEPPDHDHWTLVPSNARRRFKHLLSMQATLLEHSEASPYNTLTLAGTRGFIASGIANNYVKETLDGRDHDLSSVSVGVYPLPVEQIRALVEHCDEVTIIEEGYPLIERRLNGLLGLKDTVIKGKLTGDIPLDGELTPTTVAAALGVPLEKGPIDIIAGLANRPPQLCKGCPHIDSFGALVESVTGYEDPFLFSDIGCYTLGVLPPFRAVHATVDMGASIAMAHGAARAGHHPVVCTIGDSTFGHSGMTPLLSAAQADAHMTVLVLDNATTAMTGAQDSLTAGDRLLDVLRGLGVAEEHLIVINPMKRHHDENVAILKREIEHPGLSVVVPVRACIHIKPVPKKANVIA